MKFVLHVCVVLVLDKIIYGSCNSSDDESSSSTSSETDPDSGSESSDSSTDSESGGDYVDFGDSNFGGAILVEMGSSDRIEGKLDADLQRFISEIKAGSIADLFGTNQHSSQPDFYLDLSRRFVPQYPYTEVKYTPETVEKGELKPKMAPPEVVLAIAKESALLEASKPLKPTDEDMQKEILRTGEFWNDVWKEEVNPESLLRTDDKKRKNLETINVTIMPGSSLYDMVSKLKEKSSRLLYIINNKQKKK